MGVHIGRIGTMTVIFTECELPCSALIVNFVDQPVIMENIECSPESGPIGAWKLLFQIAQAYSDTTPDHEIENQKPDCRWLDLPPHQFGFQLDMRSSHRYHPVFLLRTSIA